MNEITLRKIYWPFLTGLMLSCAVLCVSISIARAATEKKPLPVDQAFAFSVSFVSAHQIEAQWQIAPGYYLYSNKTHLRFDPDLSASIYYPQGIAQHDALRGHYKIYTGHLRIPVSFAAAYKQIHMYIDYQGCSAQGFCYPPIKKSVMLHMQQQRLSSVALQDASTPLPSLSLHTLLKDQNGVHALLDSHKLGVLLLIFICLGLLLTLTPCVLPMIPILTSIIVGQEKNRGTQKAFLLSLCYVMGMALTYALAGLVAASLGSSIQVWLQKPIFILLVSLLFILLAFSLFDLYELRLPRRWHHQLMHWSNQHQGGTFVGVFLMGVLSTLIVSPCVTAPLIGVLIYISHTGDKILGALTLFAMGIGMGIPLLLIGMSAGHWLPKSGRWLEAMKKFFGLMMMGMAIWLSARVFSPTIIYLLTGLFILGIAVFFGYYLPR
jgi:thiol:disulfide interchange protein DsbD